MQSLRLSLKYTKHKNPASYLDAGFLDIYKCALVLMCKIIEQVLLKPDGQYPEILKLLDTWPLYSLKGLKAVCFDALN